MNYLRYLPKLISRASKNPAVLLEILHYYKNDFLSALRFYSYEHRIIFIAGLPKSGTTWLLTQLANIPGYNIRLIDDPKGVTKNHDIPESVFSSLPGYGYSVLKLHTHYSLENLKIILKYVP